MSYFYSKIQSPVGWLHIVADDDHLLYLYFNNGLKELRKLIGTDLDFKKNSIIKKTETQLREYFVGKRKKFDLPLKLNGTNFQNSAWKTLQAIPYGKTISYGEQAKQMKNPKAVRAVGGANGKNKICIIVPCHRVIGQDGSLTGFGGGTEIKKQLLQLEKAAFKD